MCGLDVYKVSRRAFAAGHRGPPRTVPLCIHGRREGHFHVCQRGVHVVDVVQRARESVHGVSTSCACMRNGWHHRERPTRARAGIHCCIQQCGREGVNKLPIRDP